MLEYTDTDVQDWQYEVANGDTFQGFYEWLKARDSD